MTRRHGQSRPNDVKSGRRRHTVLHNDHAAPTHGATQMEKTGVEMTRRSFWGWGYEARFPDKAQRAQMGAMVGAVLGIEPPDPASPPSLDSVTLSAPSVQPPASLSALCTDDRYERALHAYGASYPDIARGFSGDFSGAPDWVALPRSEDDVAALLDWCGSRQLAAIPFGGGTSVVGGTDATRPEGFKGVVSVDLRHLGETLSIDRRSLTARIQGGALGPALEDALGAQGLTLRHFPQSFEFSTLGGWLATRSGGHFATVYTHIDDLTAGVRMITPRGPIESAPLPASGAGPDPRCWALGSEGTFGVITEATMRVRPRPTWRAQVSVAFKEFRDAVEAVRALSQSGLFPTNCRLLDGREAQLHNVLFDGRHVLLLGFESPSLPRDAAMSLALEICRAHRGDALGDVKVRHDPDAATPRALRHQASTETQGTDKRSANWRRAFIDAPYLVNTMVSLGVIADTFETACTWSAFEALHADIIRSVRQTMKDVCGKGRISCRFTHVYPDGPAPYYTFIAPGRPGHQREQWAAIKAAASDVLVRHGATITHHHAVGRTHKPWYQQQTDPLFLETLRATKAHLDPQGVLNPGTLL